MEQNNSVLRHTRVIGVGNQKGGAGKTTNTVHIAWALAELGRKVLIIDLDMNYCATRHFGIKPQAFLGAFEMLLGEEPAPNVVLSQADAVYGVKLPKNLDLIPASRKLEGIEKVVNATSKFMTPLEMLKNPLNLLRGKYDYIFLDTAPNATMPTLAAYLNAEYFILSAIPEPWAIEGLDNALRDIMDSRARGNAALVLLGVIISAGDTRNSLTNKLTAYVENSFRASPDSESLKFKTSIPRCTALPTAQEDGKTLFETKPKHAVTDQYRALAAEVEERLRQIEEHAAKTKSNTGGSPLTTQEVVNG